MKAIFKLTNPETYILEHDDFINRLAVETNFKGITGIEYRGNIPPDCIELKFSRYLALNGCTRVPTGFCGFFGKQSYSETLFHFINESVSEFAGTVYRLTIDVPELEEDTSNKDIAFYVDNFMVNK